MEHYFLRHGDIITISDSIIPPYNDEIFFSIDKDEKGNYSLRAADGTKYPFPITNIEFIRNAQGWWNVTKTHFAPADLAQYHDISYTVNHADQQASSLLEFLYRKMFEKIDA